MFDGQTVRAVLRTHFRARPKDVAWIIPADAMTRDVVLRCLGSHTPVGPVFDISANVR